MCFFVLLFSTSWPTPSHFITELNGVEVTRGQMIPCSSFTNNFDLLNCLIKSQKHDITSEKLSLISLLAHICPLLQWLCLQPKTFHNALHFNTHSWPLVSPSFIRSVAHTHSLKYEWKRGNRSLRITGRLPTHWSKNILRNERDLWTAFLLSAFNGIQINVSNGI